MIVNTNKNDHPDNDLADSAQFKIFSLQTRQLNDEYLLKTNTPSKIPSVFAVQTCTNSRDQQLQSPFPLNGKDFVQPFNQRTSNPLSQLSSSRWRSGYSSCGPAGLINGQDTTSRNVSKNEVFSFVIDHELQLGQSKIVQK